MRIPGTLLQAIFPSTIWRGTAGSIHLTFDDGPHPSITPRILETLQSYGAKATFFVVGRNAAANPEIVRQILAEGHVVGNHSFDHSLMVFRPLAFLERQIRETAEIIAHIAGYQTTLFRPPYGYCGPSLFKAVRRLNHRMVFWNLDPRDWKKKPRKRIVDTVCGARRGSIVLLHENARTAGLAEDVLKEILDRLSASSTFAALST